jgi:hypothetical protein
MSAVEKRKDIWAVGKKIVNLRWPNRILGVWLLRLFYTTKPSKIQAGQLCNHLYRAHDLLPITGIPSFATSTVSLADNLKNMTECRETESIDIMIESPCLEIL